MKLLFPDMEARPKRERKTKQYIYIAQAKLESAKCKIGKTNNLERRLKEYNNMTGKSKDNPHSYLFTCEVKNMQEVENDIKSEFITMREEASKEIYFHNSAWFNEYVKFIKSHTKFVKEIFIKPEDKKQVVKIVKKTAPTLKERGLTTKAVMQRAKRRTDNDEFYTRPEDIEKELSQYPKSVWKNKTVFCNCDDAVDNNENNTSAFALYFLRNFKELKLKKLICTHYSGQVDLFNQGAMGYIFTKTGYREVNDLNNLKKYPTNYSGSFDDPLSLKILKEDADIVCTNPPFSRMIDYWKVTIGSGKKFLIISSVAVPLTTAYVHYFKNKKVWAGYEEVNWFLTPRKELTRASGYWFTNIPIKNRPKHRLLKIMPLKDIPEKHKKFDDSKMLLVDMGHIPSNYRKPFGVSTRPILNGLLEKGYKIIQDKEYYPYIDGKKQYSRVLVKKG